MSELTIDIERVVREVLAELAAAQKSIPECPATCASSAPERPATAVAGATGGNSHASPGPQSRGVDPGSNGELAVNAPVVTMLELSGRLDGVRRVVVPPKAIVTPAVRDELIRRGIALAYGDSPNGRAAVALRLALITTGTDFDPGALIAGLTREGWKIEHTALDCLIAATDQLGAEVAKPDTLGVLLTRHTAAGLCLANRIGGVRAVAGCDAPAVAAAAAAVGANVLLADPQSGTFFQVKQMVTEFCRGGVRSCPAVFRAKLA